MAMIIVGGIRDRVVLSAGFLRTSGTRQVLPALVLVMACCIPFAWAWMTPSQLKDFGESALTASLFVSNFHFWQQTGYFGPDAELMPLLDSGVLH